MRNDVLVPLGIVAFLGVHAILHVLGFPVPPTDLGAYTSFSTLVYLSAVLGSIALIVGGTSYSIGIFTWRIIVGIGYVLIAIPFLASIAYVDLSHAYGSQLLGFAAIGCSVLLLLAMAVDIALDSRVIVTFESSRGQ
jgi:hypothetical protein